MTFRRISSDNNSTLRNVDILVCQVSNSIQGYNSILYSLINDISSLNLDHFFEIIYVSWSTTHLILSVWFCHKRDSNTYIFILAKVMWARDNINPRDIEKHLLWYKILPVKRFSSLIRRIIHASRLFYSIFNADLRPIRTYHI